ncbi:MAG: transcription antitermination factor NusB [Brevinematia bacterium]
MLKFDKTISREISLQGIYQHLLGVPNEDILKLMWVEEVLGEELEYRNKKFILQYSRKILEFYFSKYREIEGIFTKFYTKNPETISSIDKAILLLGITMLLLGDVSHRIVIDEIVNLSKAYSSGNTVYKMVNKFMDSVAKNQSVS